MLFNAAVLAAALLANEAVAANIHRHGRAHMHKRQLNYVEEEVTVTDWTTVTVYEDYPEGPKSVYMPGAHQTPSLSISASANSTTNSTTPSTAPATSTTVSSSSSSSSSIYVPPTTPTTLVTSTVAPSPSPAPSTSTTPIPTPTPTPTPTTSTPAPVPTTSSSSAVINVNQQAPAVVPETPTVVDTPAAATTTAAPAPPTTTEAAAPTVAATTAAAVATTAASSSSSSSGTKRGLAYNSGSLLEPFLASGSKCSWSYNWGSVADSSAPSTVEYVPMLWGPGKTSSWASDAETAISNGATNFLSFNECDNVGQCNLDAASAAAKHIELLNPYADRVRIGTPAITNSNLDGEGVSWLTSFLSACNGECSYDFCAAHWYNTPDADDFFSHLEAVHDACGKPVWITEFAPLGSDDEINSFLEEVLDKLDNDSTYDFVERYSYFMAATGSLLSSETSLSTYGQTYAFS